MEKMTIKAARINVGLTQEMLAEKMGVHRQTISSWESNPSAMQIKEAERLCSILGVSFNQIFSKVIQQNVENTI